MSEIAQALQPLDNGERVGAVAAGEAARAHPDRIAPGSMPFLEEAVARAR